MAESGSDLGLADKGSAHHMRRGVIGGDDAATLLSPRQQAAPFHLPSPSFPCST